jgi:hypothetical protein
MQSDIKDDFRVPFICRSACITFIHRPDGVISSNSNLRVALELS